MKYSIIIPVFNSENTIERCLKSLDNITTTSNISFEVIMVNDGSTDATLSIIENFKNQSNVNLNIKSVDNGGPSRARNIGISIVSEEADFIFFMDADDEVSSDLLLEADEFFEKNNDLNLAMIKAYYDGDFERPHRLNQRFDDYESRIDILQSPEKIQYYTWGVFIRHDLLKGEEALRFNESMDFWEDALFINQLIMKEVQYGLLHNPYYLYHRDQDSSLIKTAWYKQSRYTPLIESGYLELIRVSESIFGYVIPYIQFLVVYHYKLFAFQRFNKIAMKKLNKNKQRKFLNKSHYLFKFIDDEQILKLGTKWYIIEYLLKLKHGNNVAKKIIRKNRPPIEEEALSINEVMRNGRYITIKGEFKSERYSIKEDDEIYIKHRKGIAQGSKFESEGKALKVFDLYVYDSRYNVFTITFPITLAYHYAIIHHDVYNGYKNELALFSIKDLMNLSKIHS
ncbi:glycosyltransferase family 2 protein [Alkalibacillus sp. S2W]|uniref:glycosyltransferase family 2 protein n=1 Tax=Alkalibacillus sp. S2W TaxID=3386553 RepID=UPI00398D0188